MFLTPEFHLVEMARDTLRQQNKKKSKLLLKIIRETKSMNDISKLKGEELRVVKEVMVVGRPRPRRR